MQVDDLRRLAGQTSFPILLVWSRQPIGWASARQFTACDMPLRVFSSSIASIASHGLSSRQADSLITCESILSLNCLSDHPMGAPFFVCMYRTPPTGCTPEAVSHLIQYNHPITLGNRSVIEPQACQLALLGPVGGWRSRLGRGLEIPAL